MALVCEECSRLITLSISAWDRRFTEEARSSLGSAELRFFSINDSERGVDARRSYRLLCSASVRTRELRVRCGDSFAIAASRTIGDFAIVVCAFRREKISSPETLPPPSGEVKLRMLIMDLDASGIWGANECRLTASSTRATSRRSFSSRLASASWLRRSCTGSESL